MLADWQSLAAPALVILTLAAFAIRAWKRARSRGRGCGGGCGYVRKAKL